LSNIVLFYDVLPNSGPDIPAYVGTKYLGAVQRTNESTDDVNTELGPDHLGAVQCADERAEHLDANGIADDELANGHANGQPELFPGDTGPINGADVGTVGFTVC
jgi:hypothetical protein